MLPFPIKSHQKKRPNSFYSSFHCGLSVYHHCGRMSHLRSVENIGIMMIPNNYIWRVAKSPNSSSINRGLYSSRHNLPLSLGDSSLAAWGETLWRHGRPFFFEKKDAEFHGKLWKKCPTNWKWWEYIWEYHAIVGRISLKFITVWKIRFPMRLNIWYSIWILWE